MQPVTEPDFIAAPPGSYLVAADADLVRTVWALSQLGWRPLLIDRHTAGNKRALLDAFATGLGFPDWFGNNWDALVDMLRQWASYQPLAVVIADVGSTDASNAADGVGPADHDSSDGGFHSDSPPEDELATVATLTDIIDDLVVEGHPLKLGMVPIA